MQAVLLEVLQQHAAGTVDDALGDTGGTAGVEDIERMGKGHRDEIRLAARAWVRKSSTRTWEWV